MTALSPGVPASDPERIVTFSEKRESAENFRAVLKTIGPPLALLVVLVTTWELVSRLELVNEWILPSPFAVFGAMISLGASSLFWDNAGITAYETVAGFLLGSGLAFLIAVVSGLSPWFRAMISPYMVILQVTPRVAITPIIIAWLGFGPEPKIVLAATICFFPVFINTLTGMLSVDSESMELYRSLRASRWQTLRQLVLPSSLPVIFAGLKTAMTLALIGAIVGEFVSAQEGLGLLVQRFSYQLDMASAFAVILYLTLLGLILYWIMEYLDRRLVFWQHDDRLNKLTQRLERRELRRSRDATV